MKLISIAVFLLFCCGKLYSQQLELEINGNLDFGNFSIIPDEAGLDYSVSLESTEEILLTVNNIDYFGKRKNPKTKWTIEIRIQPELAGNAVIEVKRSGTGRSSGSPAHPNIHNGDYYRPVTGHETYFFHGKGEVNDIPIRFRLAGISVLQGGDLSSQSKLIFNIEEGWK